MRILNLRTLCALALVLAAPLASGAVAVRDLAGCKPGADDPMVTSDGMFRVYLVCDHLLLQIPDRMYGRDLLLNTEFAGISGGSESISPGTLVDSRVVRIIRRGAKVNVVAVKFEIASARAPGIARGVEATSLNTVMQSVDIVGRESNGEAVIDVTPMFVIKPPPAFAIGFMKQFGMSEIDPGRSFIDKVKAFPNSIAIHFQQTWVADRGDLMRRTGEGEESVNAAMGFSFSTNIYLLPEKPMRPRFVDPRVGYFSTDFQDYGTGDTGGKTRGYIQRYRLEKKDPKAPLSDPVKPIVFYIGRGVPDAWRPYLKRAVEDWQVVFTKAGFSNAIIARDAPTEAEDPSWDADDVRYNVIRWTPSGRKNALGAAVVDPRSGEVVSSHTLLWHDVLKLIETWYFTQASPLDPRAQKLPLPTDLMGELLTYVIRHEIGHALGLRHNFKASAAVTAKNLRDPKWTALWGTSSSTMSYARFNYVAQPGDGASLIPKFGPYDYFAIEWGYSQFPDDGTHDDEAGRLDAIAARQVTDPMLRFGGEDDAAQVDPSVFSNVLCGDPIECGDFGLRNIDRVMSFIVPATTRTGEGYEKLSKMYEALVQQRHHELTYVARMVGGVVETRYQAGRGTVPFVPLDPARQRQAVNFLVKRAFTEPKALLDPDVLYRIIYSGGSTPLQGSNVGLLRRLIDPSVFNRMTEASSQGRGRYAAIDMLSDLNDGLFSELATKAPVVTPYRRQVQRSYVTVLLTGTGNVNDPAGGSANIDSTYVDSGSASKDKQKNSLKAQHQLSSSLADTGAQYAGGSGALSEYRATLRDAVGLLYKKIDKALPGITDADTRSHLRLLQSQLANVS